MRFSESYRQKLCSAREAVAGLGSGSRVYIHSNAAAPLALVNALCEHAQAAGLSEVTAQHLLALGDLPYLREGYAGPVRHGTWFVGANARRAVSSSRADYMPIFLSEIHRAIEEGPKFDACLLQVSPPEEHGFCSLGVDVTLCHTAVQHSRIVVAQVNPQMPKTLGESFLHLEQIDRIVEVDQELPELSSEASGPEFGAIGRHIAGLIEDGDCLQMGIGAIPDAVLDVLQDRHDLGIHTEMFSNKAVELMERGVITGARKQLNPGKAVTSFILGNRSTYDFVHNNPLIEMRPVEYTNDPFNIARLTNMVAINACLQIDLTGQVVSDNLGSQIVSGFGGQVDFIRGAARSKGGRPIIAMPSTARNGSISRIVAEHPAGYGITTTRADVHWVATEYGITNLFGRNRRERAGLLIDLAHPDFRAGLFAEAERLRLI